VEVSYFVKQFLNIRLSMSLIPHHLLEQIKAGNVVLFLGAGASFGAKNSKGETILSGQGLSDKLAEKFLGKEYIGKDLAYVSELAISESSLYEVQYFVAEIFKAFEPEQHHLKIPTFFWKSIFTTNYDLIIEKSYQRSSAKLQDLVPIIINTPEYQINGDIEKPLPYYKIHGCLTYINDPEAPLIMTPDQFVNHKSKRDRLYNRLLEVSNDYPILFVGFGMSDIDIRTILNSLSQNLSARVRSYMVGPNITPLEQKMWDVKKISGIKMSFEQLIYEIDNNVDRNSRVLAAIRPNYGLPIFNRFIVSPTELKPSESFIQYIQEDIEFVHSNMSSPNTVPKEFYKGHFENWDPILKNLDINRKIKDGILGEVFMDDDLHTSNQQFFYLIKGNAGSGKSVFLKRLAFDASSILDRFCIFLNDVQNLKIEHIFELYRYVKDRIYLFIDNVSALESEVIYLLNKSKREKIPITVIGAERVNVWNMECESLNNYLTQSYQIKYLHNAEIRELLNLLEKHGSLGTLVSKSESERFNAFEERAGRELLVALYEATNSKPFEEIIHDEFKSITNARAQSLYITISIFHRLGVGARAGFISRMHGINFNEFKEQLFKPLEFIVFDKKDKKSNDYAYFTRNRLIAEIIFERAITTPQDRYDEYMRILNNLNLDFEGDRAAFLAITNARNLINVFTPKQVREIYNIAELNNGIDPKLLQQKAIFEMNSSEGNIDSANRYLREAHKLLPDDPIISHSFAEMMYKRAERSTINTDFFTSIDDCLEICNAIINRNKIPNNSHPYHTSLKALVLKLKHILESNDAPSIERTIKEIEKMFSSAKQLFPNGEFILEIEAKFNEIINQKENAKALLQKAFDVNKGSPFLALRLANFYEKEEDIETSLSVIKESLTLNSGDRDLNLKYGMLLEKAQNPNYEDVKYYLRRSFTKGDNRYFAQLWYARCLFILNQLAEAKEIFDFLSSVNIAPEIKRNLVGKLKRNNRHQFFEGIITKVEISHGFIKRDGLGDFIYFFRYDDDYEWDKFIRNKRVSFIIGFNYYGPVALSINVLE
jgi:hypothetical protein